jgi:hypothetical protein
MIRPFFVAERRREQVRATVGPRPRCLLAVLATCLLSAVLAALPVLTTSFPTMAQSSSNTIPALTLGTPVSGDLAVDGQPDSYSLTLDAADAAQTLSISLDTASSFQRTLCLEQPDGTQLKCRTGTGSIALTSLLLPAADYLVTVAGAKDPAAGYQLVPRQTGPPQADQETEPNDSVDTANPLTPGILTFGESRADDLDTWIVTTSGEAQTWHLDAHGTGLSSLTWLSAGSQTQGEADVSKDGTTATLWDLYLPPGRYWFQILANGPYTLQLFPSGAPSPGAEHEPNNDELTAEPLVPGVPRTGRLSSVADQDVYHFSSDVDQHVAIHVTPPSHGAITMRFETSDEPVGTAIAAGGAVLDYETLIHPGDYDIKLTTDSPSQGTYTIEVDHADPFVTAGDLEPNDTPAQASPMPADLVVDGSGWSGDADWYQLPSLTSDAPISVSTTGTVDLVALTDADGNDLGAVLGADGTTWTTDTVSAGTQPLLEVEGEGAYRATVTSDGLPVTADPGRLPVTLSLTASQPTVAAYSTLAQALPATLHITNTGSEDLDLDLDARTSQASWSAEIPQPQVTVPAQGALDVPVTIDVLADAWADVPVRTTLRATQATTGRSGTAFLDITPNRDAAPVAPALSWDVPSALLGGLDVAATALGAQAVTGGDAGAEAQLYDGFAMWQSGVTGGVTDGPQTFTVDLATDDAVPVSGVIIDPLAGSAVIDQAPRAFDLLLSQDGSDYAVALSGHLSALQQDQSFVLPQPVNARFAQLRIDSTWGSPSGPFQLGEFQVIATPGWAPAQPFNVADPALGGHVVMTEPGGATDPPTQNAMLTEAVDSSWSPDVSPGATVQWVIGFHEDRAAQVQQMEWVGQPASDPATGFGSVQVEVSTDTALGPWAPAGTWQLKRSADGSVKPFDFPAPTWARFIRFTGTAAPKVTLNEELPETLRVIERPTDSTYRSILGAWGRNNPAGIYEALTTNGTSVGAAQPPSTPDGNDSPQTATPLAPATTQHGQVQRGVDVDWYTLTVPAGQDQLVVTLGAAPDDGVQVTLQDATGHDVDVAASKNEDGTQTITAAVDPGATYRMEVEQLPVSTSILYDTSLSMLPHLPYVYESLRSFAAGVTPGEETVEFVPFQDASLLPDFSDDPYALGNVVANITDTNGSSNAEPSLLTALNSFQTRPGTHAIVIITDAETGTFDHEGDVWSALDRVRPTIFSIQVDAGDDPADTIPVMQDWAHSQHGDYEYAVSHGDIDRAFDRLATWLRRPADYSVSYATSVASKLPGDLQVITPVDSPTTGVAGAGVSVELVFDTSGSMLDRLSGTQTRIDVARQVLTNLVQNILPPGIPTALRVFDRQVNCGTKLLVPLSPLDPAAMASAIEGVQVKRATNTPIGAALDAVAGDLAGSTGPRIVVLVTDGQENCGGNPAKAVQNLVAQGLDVTVNIVGFAIDDKKIAADLARWAQMGHGQSFNAGDAGSLATSIESALRAPYRVYDSSGALVASGTVDGSPVSLPPGTYRVEVLSNPPATFSDVRVTPGGSIQLTLPAAGQAPSPAP